MTGLIFPNFRSTLWFNWLVIIARWTHFNLKKVSMRYSNYLEGSVIAEQDLAVVTWEESISNPRLSLAQQIWLVG